ncbi:MAG: chemotaxis protein CheR [Burkholderiaceae bacterium]|nr:chemotaxis protein CheR [Burkholderiaceae bacterium]
MLDPRIATLLREHFGLDPASIGTQGVARIVGQRAALACEGDIERYWHVLSQSTTELRLLVEALVVPETWFFRYPESLDRVAACVAAVLRRRIDGSPVRILSMPCSTGEEPYSVAIALRDMGIAPAQVQIDALDISEVAIERARRGQYGRNAFRSPSMLFRDRYFTALPDGRYLLADEIRDQVEFRCENLFALSPYTLAQAYDLVLCRNLLIYFDVPTQQQAIDVLKQLCSPDGVLFLGPAEAGVLVRMGHRPMGEPAAFAFESRAQVSRPSAVLAMPSVPSASERSPAVVPTTPVSSQAGGRTSLSGADRFAESAIAPSLASSSATACSDVSSRAASFSDAPSRAASLSDGSFSCAASIKTLASSGETSVTHDEAAIEAVRRLADRGRVAEAADAAQRLIEQDSANAEAHYWVGLCRDVQGQKAAAAMHYRKAIYLAPAHVEALNHLAALLDEQGDDRGAQRLRLRAMREEARHGG